MTDTSHTAPLLGRDHAGDPQAVRALQRSLRALGYQRSGVTGVWSGGTDAAVQALRHDLIHNHGIGPPGEGPVPVSIASFNASGAVVEAPASGAANVEPALAACIAAMMADTRIGKVPYAANPVSSNATVWAQVGAIRSTTAPTPFLKAIFRQESDGRHYHVPGSGDEDGFVILGLDHNDKSHPQAITSRGYGIGQFTFFHHPLSVQEVAQVVVDPVRNVSAAFSELRGKFDTAVMTSKAGEGAEDRQAEHPLLAMRLCKYPVGDVRRMTDCAACAHAARKIDTAPGQPVYRGASLTWTVTQYYPSCRYSGVPDRADFTCDWPYAVRRYNGGGINSYHYQVHVLTNLLT